MSKKSIRDFAELRSLMKKTETEAEVKELLKGESSSRRPTLPVAPKKLIRQPLRQLSSIDQFVVDTLKIPLDQLSPDQLPGARDTVREAMACTQDTLLSIKRQLESVVKPVDEDWKRRAEASLKFKIHEGQELQKRMLRIDELIAQAKPSPPLKLVVAPSPPPPPPPTKVKPPPPSQAAAYEIRSNAPRPNIHQSEEWRKYPFDKLGIDQSFRFGAETADQVRKLINSAQRHLGRHFSYRTEPDGVIAVWRIEAPHPFRGKK